MSWKLGSPYGHNKVEVVTEDGNRAIATVWVKRGVPDREIGRETFVDDLEGIARAHIIVAAPELLEALQTTAANLRSIIAASNHRQYDEWLATVEAAISKATGEAK